jgi:hypothetical protein
MASGEFSYMTNGGGPFQVTITNLVTGRSVSGDTFTFTLPANETTIYQATSAAPTATGWALISTNSAAGGNGTPVSGTAAFILEDAYGNVLSSAGVGGMGFVTQFSTPVANRNPDMRTGIAVASMANVPNNITLSLFDPFGNLLNTRTLTLPAFGHYSAFVDEIFGMPLPVSLSAGMLSVTGSQLMSGITLEFFGYSMTTFPLTATTVTALDITGEARLIEITQRKTAVRVE